MEETSDRLNPTTDTSGITPEFDSKTMRSSKPGLKRLFITTTVLFSFLSGLPFLWKSVEIYRSPLPFHDIDSLSDQIKSTPLRFPCTFHAVFVGFRSTDPDQLRSEIQDGINQLTHRSSQCGSCNVTLSVTVQNPDDHCSETLPSTCSYRCGVIKRDVFGDGLDDTVDESLDGVFSGCSGDSGKMYSVVVVNKEKKGNGEDEVKAVVGKRRHAWIVGSGLEERYGDLVARVSEIFGKVFMNGGREEDSIHGEFMPVGSDGRLVLSFSLLNSNPRDWIYDWDFQRIDEALLAPVTKALAPIADISVESQVLYHTPKSSFSSWDEKLQSYIFRTSDLPFFVNSNEWHLDTSAGASGRSKILQFVVYIPSGKECPLHLQLPNGEISKTNGFISPMWGGVIVWNPGNCDKDFDSESPSRNMISPQDLEKIVEVFLGQFRQLFGFKSEAIYTSELGSYKILPSERGFTEWELDVLSRKHTCFNLHSCATTLGSLSRLVQSLPRMIIKDEIGEQVKYSLKAAKLAQSNASLGGYSSSASSSREARSLAENAFFHPSIMSVSYFSYEHCFAVYSPFFLPVAGHVVLAALREWKRYKQEKAKYLTWLTRKKTA